MRHSFIAYIDESGDDGLKKFRQPGAQGGASTWLGISACLIRYSRELEAVQWRDEISNQLPNKTRRDIHFAHMKHQQKIMATQVLASKKVRAITVLANKTYMDPDIYSEKNRLYFYLTRYLIERLSWLCRDLRPKVPEGNGTLKIVFSRRGGMSYSNFRDYLTLLKSNGFNGTNIHWPVIDIPNIDAQDHSKRAGLQLSDIIASAFTAALEPDVYGNCESRYAETLKPIVYSRNGNFLSYGVKLIPKINQNTLSEEQTKFLELYK